MRFSGSLAGLAISIGALVGPCMALGQESLYSDVTGTNLPGNLAGQCMDAAAGDADGDGDLDLALAMEFEPNVLLLNDGNAVFSDASGRLPRTRHDSEDVAFADFDGDADLDIVLVSEDDRTNELYINDGSGRFSDASDRLPVGGTSNALEVLDLNDDDAPDLLIGNAGIDRALLNDGRGNFSDESETYWQNDARTQDLELADVDGDGDLDLIVANEGQNQLFLNEHGRGLIEATEGRMPVRSDETREIKAADIDADGDLDLVVANVRFLLRTSRRDFLLLNDGSGVFTEADVTRLPDGDRDHFTVQVVDLDDDDDIDIVAPTTIFGNQSGDYRVLVNNGAAVFSVAQTGSVLPASANGNGFDIEVADFDGDGRADLFLCNRASNPRSAIASGGRQKLLLARDR